MAVEVFADVGCPFTHIGLARFVEARAERGLPEVRLRVHAWPLEIVNGKPMDPEFIAEEIDEIRGQVDGDYFGGFEAASFPRTSLPAMALASAGYERDDATGESISLELRRLLFNEGTDISDPEVLAAVARRHSVIFDPADHDSHREVVNADYDRGRSRGVVGSPHFFTSEGDFFCPALTIGRDDQGRLHVEADPVAFAAFLDVCLGGS